MVWWEEEEEERREREREIVKNKGFEGGGRGGGEWDDETVDSMAFFNMASSKLTLAAIHELEHEHKHEHERQTRTWTWTRTRTQTRWPWISTVDDEVISFRSRHAGQLGRTGNTRLFDHHCSHDYDQHDCYHRNHDYVNICHRIIDNNRL